MALTAWRYPCVSRVLGRVLTGVPARGRLFGRTFPTARSGMTTLPRRGGLEDAAGGTGCQTNRQLSTLVVLVGRPGGPSARRR